MLHTPSEHIGSLVPLYGAGESGGGGGGQTQDHQAPKIIVGNQTEGDSGFVCDVLDTGNGAGLATAIFQAAIEGSDIWVRPGAIDFNLPGAPALPLTIPGNCTLRGAGVNEVLLIPPSSGNAQLFILDDGAALERMGILVRGVSGGTRPMLVETMGAARLSTITFQFDVTVDGIAGALTTCVASHPLMGSDLTFVRLLDVQMIFAVGQAPGAGVGVLTPATADPNSVVFIATNVFMANVARGWDLQGSAVLFLTQGFIINTSDVGIYMHTPFGDLVQCTQCVVILDERAPGACGARLVDGQASFHQCLFGGNNTAGCTLIEASGTPNNGGQVQIVGCEINGGDGSLYGVHVIAGQNTPTLQVSASTIQGTFVTALQIDGGDRHTIVGNDIATYQPNVSPSHVIVCGGSFSRIEANNILYFPNDQTTDQAVQLFGRSNVFAGNIVQAQGGAHVVVFGDDCVVQGNRIDSYSQVFDYCIQTAANVQRVSVNDNRINCQGRPNAPAIYLYGADHTASNNLLWVNGAAGIILNAQTCVSIGNRVVGRGVNPPVDDQQGTSDVAHNL